MRRIFTLFGLSILAICAAAQTGTPAGSSTPAPTAAPQAAEPQPIKVDPPSESATVAELESSADKLREQNMYRDAVDYYDVALKKEPRNAVLWNKRGIALLQMGRYRDGQKSFEKSIHFDKKYP